MRKSYFDNAYLRKTILCYLIGFNKYDDVPTYNGAHELDEEPWMSSSPMLVAQGKIASCVGDMCNGNKISHECFSIMIHKM